MYLESVIVRAASVLAAVGIAGALLSHRPKAPADRQTDAQGPAQRS